MFFNSILFKNESSNIKDEMIDAPECFSDLNLDQVIDAITVSKQEYNLKPFFYYHLNSIDEILYRHEIMKDLENADFLGNIISFSEKMSKMREHLAKSEKFYYKYQKESLFLDAVLIYCDAVTCLNDDLNNAELKSHGFSAFKEYIKTYLESEAFKALREHSNKLKYDLSTIKYSMLIKGTSIKVFKYESEPDYNIILEETFKKFKQAKNKEYNFKFKSYLEMNHVEAGILDCVAQLYPEIFLDLDDYFNNNQNFIDEKIKAFDREIQFYIAYIEYMDQFRRKGLKFCYPKVSDTCKEIYNHEGFDIALAYKFINNNSEIVCNDFYMKDKERIFVITGPNQGGKTTFARAFGQIHYLASLGCPVPGKDAQLFLFDNIFTHFEKEETINNLSGKLQEELVRIYDILNKATSNSIIIMNEIFTSTTLNDAVFLGKKIMEKIMQLDLLCVCVTFIYELAYLSEKTVSLVSTTLKEKPEERTYKIIRKPADGLSYAITIAQKYGLTYEKIKERIQQ